MRFRLPVAPMFLLGVSCFVNPLIAQDGAASTVDGRLLDILKSRGVITTSEYAELKKLEADLRVSADLERNVDAKIEEMVARAVQDAPKTSYKPGAGFTFATADKNFSMTVGARVMIRFTYDAFDGDTVTPSGSEPGADRTDFSVSRARIYFKGTAFDPKLKYTVQFDAAGDQARPASGTSFGGVSFSNSGTTNANRLAELKDAFVDYQISDDKSFNVKAGQYKIQYSREAITAAFDMEFVDRSVIFPWFGPSRAPGLSLWGQMGGEKGDAFEWTVGAFNGPNINGAAYLEGENVANDDSGLLYNARAVWNPMGAVPYSQADLRSEEERGKFLLAVGTNAFYHVDDNRRADGDSFDDSSFGVDVTSMWNGWFFTGEAHWRSDAQRNATTGTPPVVVSNDDVDITGYTAQLSYTVVPQKFNVGVRYSAVDFDGTNATTNVNGTASREYLIVAGWYMNGHSQKLLADFGRVENHFTTSSSDTDEWRLRAQFILSF